ncbi:hypothetical protein RIF23_11205 [Lipingzhangella sp. LS1_29]|uniref:Sortilin N-terminal domain-containing protein n=1 Tax=Lipingzhangella rawalii TaxID=2055835 RepID=A0ABU2H6C7_9ACTN|nr:hypothetical protein [Lipingzhangella rawalii]MDS1270869.1 hypothetical protein [Lipingzhangella rawalii]
MGRNSETARERNRARRETAERMRREQQRRTRRRGWLLGGAGVVVVAAVAAGGWALSSQDEPEPEDAVTEFTHVHGLELPEWSADRPYLATHHGLIGVDTEDDWEILSEELHDFMGFSAHPTEEGRLYSSGHPAPGSGLVDPLGFMVSEDSGRTWEVRSLEGEVDFHAMAVGADGAVIYGWDRQLYRSDDEGRTWHEEPAPELAQLEGAATLAAHPEDADTVWAGTQAGLLRSEDGGAAWEPLFTGAPVTAVVYDSTQPDRLLAYSVADGLLESTDGGSEWDELGWDVGEDAVGHLAIHPEDPEQIYAGTHGEGVYRSLDGGQNFDVLADQGSVVQD